MLITKDTYLFYIFYAAKSNFSVWLLLTVQNYEIFSSFSSLMFFVGARKPLFSRIYNFRHDGLPSYDLSGGLESRVFFEIITSVTKNHTLWIFVTDSRRRETGPVVYLRSIYFWVICLIHKMRWVLVSKDHLFIVATHILNVKMPTLGYLFEFDLSRLPEAVPEVTGVPN